MRPKLSWLTWYVLRHAALFQLVRYASVLLIAIFLTGLHLPLFAASHYIRDGASGKGDGSTWADAWPNFNNVVWTRGDTYYLAGGTYSNNLTISVPESGSTPLILKKANAAVNALDPGWNTAYETDQAVILGTVSILSSYVTIDGVTGMNRGGHGIKVYESAGSAGNAIVNLASGKSFFSLLHVEVQGPGMGYQIGVSGYKQNNINTTSKGIHLAYLWFHNLSQNGWVFVNVAGTSFSDYGLLFQNNILDNCGYNIAGGHGQGIQGGSGATGSTNSYWIIRNSIFHNVVGTAVIACLGYSQNDHLDIYNNIFYNSNQSFTPDGAWANHTQLMDAVSPGVIYFSSTGASAYFIRILNNTFYNISRNTIYFGGANLANNEVVNNLFLRGYFNQIHEGVVGSYNDYYDCKPIIFSGIYGVPYGEIGQQNEIIDPVLDAANSDFGLKAGVNAIGNGTNLSLVFTTDFLGLPRGNSWDIGAFQFTGKLLSRPTNLRMIPPSAQ